MKNIFTSIVLFFTVSVFAQNQEILPTIETNSTIPMGDYQMLDVSGEILTLNYVKGVSGLIVIFSSNTCPFVI